MTTNEFYEQNYKRHIKTIEATWHLGVFSREIQDEMEEKIMEYRAKLNKLYEDNHDFYLS